MLKEGERLSRRQAEFENTVKNLRKVIREKEREIQAHADALTETNALCSDQKDRLEQLEAHEQAFVGVCVCVFGFVVCVCVWLIVCVCVWLIVCVCVWLIVCVCVWFSCVCLV